MKMHFRLFLRYLIVIWLFVAILSGGVNAAEAPAKGVLTDERGCIFVVNEAKSGAHWSCDSGKHWQPIKSLGDIYLNRAWRKPAGGLILATGDGLYSAETIDGNFERIEKFPVALWAANPQDGSAWIRVWGDGMRYLARDGDNYKRRDKGLRRELVQDMTFDRDGTPYAGLFGGGVYRFGGQTWEPAGKGLANRNVLVLSTDSEGSLWAGTYGGGLYRMDPAQGHWKPVMGMTGRIVTCIGFKTNRILVGTRDAGLWLSGDNGKNWDQTLNDYNIQAVAVDSDDRLWAAAYADGLQRSQDNGKTWTRVLFDRPERVLQIAVAPDGGFYTLTQAGLLHYSSPGGRYGLLPLPFKTQPEEIHITMDRQGRLLAGALRAGVHASENGTIWSPLINGLPNNDIRALRSDPAGRIYAVVEKEWEQWWPNLFFLDDDDRWYPVLPDRGNKGYPDGWVDVPREGEFRESVNNYNVRDLIFLPDGRTLAWGSIYFLERDQKGIWRRDRMIYRSELLVVDMEGTLWTKGGPRGSILKRPSDWAHPEETDWERASDIPGGYTRFLYLQSGRWLATGSAGGVFVLEKGADGRMRQRFHGLMQHLVTALAELKGGMLLVGTEGGLFGSMDMGQTWSKIAQK